MSRYEWERGEILIPSADWADFKAEIREAWNAMQKRRYELALKAWEHIKQKGKGKRNFDYHRALRDHLDRLAGAKIHAEDHTLLHDIKKSLFMRKGDDERWRHRDQPLKPRKKDFPTKSNRDTRFRLGEATIAFDNDNRIVRWSVGENNHAREYARKHPVAKAFFKALRNVDWTRDSGGVLLGNDEYNQEEGRHHAGGGGSYITASYGPRGESRAGYRTDQQRRQRSSRRW